MVYEEMHERVERIARLLKEHDDAWHFMGEEDHKALSVAVQIVGEVAVKYKGLPVPKVEPRIPIRDERP